MCLQSPEYDMIEHMHDVNKWFLTFSLPRELELLEETCDTDGEYLDCCNELQIFHKQTSKAVENYSILMNKVGCQDRLKLTIECLSARNGVVNIKSSFGYVQLNLKRDEILYEEYINCYQFPTQ